MPTFHFYVLPPNGRRNAPMNFFCAGEAEAIATAMELQSPGTSVEVWLGSRMVACQTPPAPPPSVRLPGHDFSQSHPGA